MSVFYKNKKYIEHTFDSEAQFEKMVFEKHKLLFGSNTVLLDVKKKLNTGELGKTIPDGFLFDFSDLDDPKFYIVEVELASHNFYKHIFPQITKFFGFVRSSTADQAKLIDSIYRIIESNNDYKEIFKSYLKGKELFKFLKDLIEGSSDILLIIDGKKNEIDEIMETYSETWGKYVKQIICRSFKNEDEIIIVTEPDFEVVETGLEDIDEEVDDEDHIERNHYTEEFHLTDANELVKQIYAKIKNEFKDVNYNAQRYYIAMKNPKGFAIIIPRKKLIRLVVFVPIEEARKFIKNYSLKEPSVGEQRFWNARCTHVKVDNENFLDEIVNILKFAEVFPVVKVRNQSN